MKDLVKTRIEIMQFVRGSGTMVSGDSFIRICLDLEKFCGDKEPAFALMALEETWRIAPRLMSSAPSDPTLLAHAQELYDFIIGKKSGADHG